MFNWLRELYEIRADFRERRMHCESCENLRTELAAARIREQRLLEKVIYPEGAPQVSGAAQGPKIVLQPRDMPFRVRRQMLEKADREKAAQIQEEREAARIQAEFNKKAEAARVAFTRASHDDSPSAGVRTEMVTGSNVEELEREMGIS